ncbi:MAG TPA: glycosyltransferase family A protein [Gaiellaceae bacterium]|nr:glycosyltransferase family A protein [Gaiellaceae bacterium]
MTEPDLSVVVASVNGFPYVGRCLDALAEHAPQAEVIVADSTGEETRRRLREGWPGVTLLTFAEQQTVPELRAAGIFAARAPRVALIEDHCLVTPGWAAAAVAAHEQGYAAVGGPVRNVARSRLRDWAAFFCEYSRFMEPLAEGPTDDLTGMNVSYDRDAIVAVEDLLRDGRWETWLHPRLRERGLGLYCAGGMVLEHDKDFGVGEFLSQRWHYSRSYAGMRSEALGRRRYLYAVGTPLLPPVLYWRMARNVFSRRRRRREFLLATPLILLDVTTWAAGEAVGYVLGGGRSLLKVR